MKHLIKCALLISLLGAFGCSEGFRGVGSAILSSTGYVSSSQADSLMEAGEGMYKSARPVSAEEEYYIGRGVSAMLLKKYPPVTDQKLIRYVNQVGSVLVMVCDRPETFRGYRFVPVSSKEINAFAAPGGFIFVTTGFMRLLPSEDALAAVLAHEIGHIVAADGLRAISQAHMTRALGALGKVGIEQAVSEAGSTTASLLTSAFSGSVTDVFETLVTNGYSRSQEYAADKYAATLLERAGYSTDALRTVLETLGKQNAEGGMFATHPKASDRLDELGTTKTVVADAAYSKRTARFSKNVVM